MNRISDRAIYVTAQQQAYNFVREKILSGDYAGGSRLNPEQIAKALAISRMPVREALRQLDAEGLVVMRPNRGALVTRLTAAEVEELFEMRASLEGLAASFAAKEMTPDALSELQVLKEKMERARSDPRIWVRRHDDLHQFICDVSKRNRLAQEINRVRTAVQPYLLMYISLYHSMEMQGYEHDGVLAAIASGDADNAETSMRDHIRRAGSGIIEFLRARESTAVT